MSPGVAHVAGFWPDRIIQRHRGFVLLAGSRVADGENVWLKFAESAYSGRDNAAELRREAEVHRDIGEAGCLRLIETVETAENGLVLVFEPFTGSAADGLRVEARDLAAFYRFAKGAVRALADLHARCVVHKHISPAAFFHDQTTGATRLGHLGRATRMRGNKRELAGLERDLSGFAWLAPEQTGRLNWPIGFGTDLYALGIIFYELLTGRLPFEADDPVGWVHCHLARVPAPAAELDSAIPAILSSIVSKLLAKNPGDRYLSANGLLADLARAEADPASIFLLGAGDHSASFQLPERLYGRSAELRELDSALDAACSGKVQVVTVSGGPGAGKTSLVWEWHAASAGGSLFGSGKFDQLQRDQPYLGFRQAIGALCGHIAYESDEGRALWKERLNAALDAIGRVMTDNFPALHAIMGEQAPLPDLPPAEARNRFTEAFRLLIRALSNPTSPLVLFLDDLQARSLR